MKKYLLMIAVAISALMSSCTNDDIPVNKATTIKINPNTVISDFIDYGGYDLVFVSDGHKLRVRLLVYDNSGNLVESVTQNVIGYESQVQASLDLPTGSYTAVAITDVIRESDGFEYWSISGEEKLAETKITNTGYVGYSDEILGVTAKKITIGGTNNTYTIDVKPAGALTLTIFDGIHTYSGVECYELWGKKMSDYLSFNANGSYTSTPVYPDGGSSYYWIYNSVSPDEFTANGVYGYTFQLPMNNIEFKFTYTDLYDDSYELTDGFNVSFNAGDQYLFYLNLEEMTYEHGVINGSRSRSSESLNHGKLEFGNQTNETGVATPSEYRLLELL